MEWMKLYSKIAAAILIWFFLGKIWEWYADFGSISFFNPYFLLYVGIQMLYFLIPVPALIYYGFKKNG